MKIRKYQSGGIYFTPISKSILLGTDTTSSASTQKESSDTSNLLPKEIINVLVENSLPNDADYFIATAGDFLNSNRYNSLFSETSSSMNNMSGLLQLSSLANKLRYNNDLYKEALSQVKKEGSGSDAAITSTGGLYVIDSSNKIKIVSADTFYQNPDNYRILTNNELLQLRSYQPELVYNSTILSDLSNTVGMQSIMEYIRTTIESFGTNKTSNQLDSYTAKQRGKIEKGFEQLLGLSSPDGVYKITTLAESSTQGYSDEESLAAAVNYLYRTLPPNMRNVLRANTAAEGRDPNSAKEVQSILTDAILKHTDYSQKIKNDVNYETTLSKNRSGNNGSSGSPVQLPFGSYVQRNMGERRPFNMTFGDSNLNFNIPTYYYNNRSLNNEALPDVITASDADKNLRDHGLRDPYGKIFFGNIPLDNMAIEGQSIIVNNSKGLAVSYLPVDDNGNLDMTIMKIMSNIQSTIESEHITDEDQVRQIWEDNGFQYDPQKKVGVIPGMRLKRFAIQQAYTTNKGSIDNKTLKNTEFIQRADDNLIEDLVGVYNNDPSNKNKQKLDINAGWFGSSYAGLLFIPLSNNENEVNMAGGMAYTPKSDADLVKASQDFARQNGAYDINSGIYNRTLNGTTASSLD